MAKGEIVEDVRISYNGRSFPVWKYDGVPDGMRLATVRDLWYGRQVLFQLQLGEDAGKYCTSIVRGATVEILKEYIRTGVPIYVKER